MLLTSFFHHRTAFIFAMIACAGGNTAVLAAEHVLMPTPQTVHIGHFLALLKPVLSIESGDIVTLESTASIVPASPSSTQLNEWSATSRAASGQSPAASVCRTASTTSP